MHGVYFSLSREIRGITFENELRILEVHLQKNLLPTVGGGG